jgi:glyceraldehyde 3-phosphate dehydrogenase
MHGGISREAEAGGESLIVGGHRLALLRRAAARAPTVDVIGRRHRIRMHGAFTRREDLDDHIRAGARYVILSAPSKSEDVETIVELLKPDRIGAE